MLPAGRLEIGRWKPIGNRPAGNIPAPQAHPNNFDNGNFDTKRNLMNQ